MRTLQPATSLRTIVTAAALAASLSAVDAGAASLTVPASADPWLAGMPDGSTASFEDVAPGQSPVLYAISSPQIVAVSVSASGLTHHGPGIFRNADGDPSLAVFSHDGGAENGISDVLAPISSLLGVFLDDTQPDLSPAPGWLDFSTAASRDYISLSPALKQVFFFGDGLTSSAQPQGVALPAGATRLFLGTMDGYGWWNNVGELDVSVFPLITDPGVVPEGTTVLSGIAFAGILGGWAWRRRCA